jgi:hypothetical protein
MKRLKRLTLIVIKVRRRNMDTDGQWDGTWDETYKYGIHDEDGYMVAGLDGFATAEQAEAAGEKALKRKEERK